MRVPKVVMREVKRRQQLIELRKTDPGIEYKNFDYVCCQENGEPQSLTAMNQHLRKSVTEMDCQILPYMDLDIRLRPF